MKSVIHALEKIGVTMTPYDTEFLRGKPRRFFRLKGITPEGVAALIAEAKTWLRTPYHAHACVKKYGVDCVQLLRGVAEGAGIVDPVKIRNDYSTVVPKDAEYIDRLLEYCDEITEPETRAGDIAMYKTGHGWMHSAIIVEWN